MATLTKKEKKILDQTKEQFDGIEAIYEDHSKRSWKVASNPCCFDVNTYKRRQCTCLDKFVTAFNKSQVHPSIVSCICHIKTNLQKVKPSADKDPEKHFSACFDQLSKHIYPVMKHGKGQHFKFFGFPALTFCDLSLRNLLYSKDKRFQSDCLKLFERHREQLVKLTMLQALPAILGDQSSTNVCGWKDMYQLVFDKTKGIITETNFKDHCSQIRGFLEGKGILVTHPKLDPEMGNVRILMELENQPAISKLNHNKWKNVELRHFSHAFVCSLEPPMVSHLEETYQRYEAKLGINGPNINVFTKAFSGVNMKDNLKWISTCSSREGWLDLVKTLKTKPLEQQCYLGGYDSRKDIDYEKQAEEFNKVFLQAVQEMVGKGFVINYDSGFMYTGRESKHQGQVPHNDMSISDLLSLQNLGHKLLIAFMPLEPAGMWLSFYRHFDGKADKAEMLYVRFGTLAFVPATLVHAGGFRTSCTGNKRCHFYVYCSQREGKQRSLVADVIKGNDYRELDKAGMDSAMPEELFGDNVYERESEGKPSPWIAGALKSFLDQGFQLTEI